MLIQLAKTSVACFIVLATLLIMGQDIIVPIRTGFLHTSNQRVDCKSDRVVFLIVVSKRAIVLVAVIILLILGANSAIEFGIH